jgi:hypothetical protein
MTFYLTARLTQTRADLFIPRQRDDVPFNRAGRAIKKSAIVCVGLAVNLGFYSVGACLRLNSRKIRQQA